MDALALQAVKDECRDLEGTRIAAVEQYAPMEIGLVLKTGGGRRALTLSAQPGYARLHLSDGAKKSAASSALLAALRDHLLPGTLEKIAVAPFERVVDIHCQGRSSHGPRRYRLIAELIGNRGIMVFFSEPDRVILETLRRIRGADRPLVPGETYAFPPPMKKTPLSEATRELLDGTGSQATPADLARHLSATFAGLSRDMALEVLARAGLADGAGLAGGRPAWPDAAGRAENLAGPAGAGPTCPGQGMDALHREIAGRPGPDPVGGPAPRPSGGAGRTPRVHERRRGTFLRGPDGGRSGGAKEADGTEGPAG